MPDFGILDTHYRLIETHFEDDYVVLRALEIAHGREVRIITPNLQSLASPEFIQRFYQRGVALARDGGGITFYPAGSFDQRSYLVTDWSFVPRFDTESMRVGVEESKEPPIARESHPPTPSPAVKPPVQFPSAPSPRKVSGLPPGVMWGALMIVVLAFSAWYFYNQHLARQTFEETARVVEALRAEILRIDSNAQIQRTFQQAEQSRQRATQALREHGLGQGQVHLNAAVEGFERSLQVAWSDKLDKQFASAESAAKSAQVPLEDASALYREALANFKLAREHHDGQRFDAASEQYAAAIRGFELAKLRRHADGARETLADIRKAALDIGVRDNELQNADAATALAESLFLEDRYELATRQFEIAEAQLTAMIEARSIAELERLRVQAKDLRQQAMNTGARNLPGFELAQGQLEAGETAAAVKAYAKAKA